VRRRWIAYLAIGLAFGIGDFYYLRWQGELPWERLLGGAPYAEFVVRFIILNLGIWLVPAVPVVLHEARCARSVRACVLSSMIVWSAAIVSYYVTNAVHLLFVGVAARAELHISQRGAAEFAANWASVLRGHILGSIAEWMPVAVVGGAIIGALVGIIYLRVAGRDKEGSAQTCVM
jgi:hypothetical protein